MKKTFSLILIAIIMLLSVSCDLFMEYEKPDLYLVTVGLNYRHIFGGNNILANTQNDADAITELFTGFADRAGMDWYSVTYRDSYRNNLKPKELTSSGNAVIQITTSDTDRPQISPIRKDLNDLALKAEPDSIIMKCISDLIYHTEDIKAPTKNDIIVFYYAGHGMDETGDLWMVPSVFPYDKPKSLLSLHDELLGATSFLKRFPGRKVIILDSCYSGNIISDNRDTINGGLGGNGGGFSDNPYYDPDFIKDQTAANYETDGRDAIIEGNSIKPEAQDVPPEDIQSNTNKLVPEFYIITSANSDQRASDGEGGTNSPFVSGVIDELQPGWQLGDPVGRNRKRILLSDIYLAAKKSIKHNSKDQDAQTPLTRYDIVLFDFTR